MYTLVTATKDFIRHCRFEKNLSAKTIKAYQIDLKQTVSFLQKKKYSLQIQDVTKYQLREYLESISSLKPKSIKRKIATLKAMFNFLEFEDKITVNPFRKMRIRIKEPKQLPRVMDIREIQKIFKTAYTRRQEEGISDYSLWESLRDVVTVELLFATGARVSEISNLRTAHMDLTSGVITLKGKGGKERIIQVCNQETLKILRVYFELYHQKIEKCQGYFLVNRFGNKFSEQSIRNIIKRLTKIAGIPRHITPHIFRHTFATLLLEKNVDIKYIQLLLGHSSILTTQIYTHVNGAKQREILMSKHPRKDFTMESSCIDTPAN